METNFINLQHVIEIEAVANEGGRAWVKVTFDYMVKDAYGADVPESDFYPMSSYRKAQQIIKKIAKRANKGQTFVNIR